MLAHFSHTHNSSTYNFVLIDPPPPPLSFLPSPSRLNFCSDYWKKLTCGVIRSFICFFDISRKSIPESLCNWGLFSPGTINFTGSLRLRGAKRYFHVEGFLQKSLISCSRDSGGCFRISLHVIHGNFACSMRAQCILRPQVDDGQENQEVDAGNS